jgi:hypothetical protein
MAEEAANVENFEESMEKCLKISQIIPQVLEDIHQIQKLDKSLEVDFNLKLAEQNLTSLDTIRPSDDEKGKEEYVNNYRDTLVSGLTCLGDFLTGFTDLKFLTPEQRNKMTTIAANISIHQEDSIIKVSSL